MGDPASQHGERMEGSPDPGGLCLMSILLLSPLGFDYQKGVLEG